MTRTPSALIIGGSGVIGRVIAYCFGQKRWSVSLHYHRNKKQAEQTAKAIREQGGNPYLFQADIRDSHQVENMVHLVRRQCNRLDVLIFAAGIATSNLVVKTSQETWNDLILTNLSATFFVLKAVGPIFQEQRDGTFIIIGSYSGLQGMPGQAAYAASKAGLLGLMKSTAKEWGPCNIRINTVFPGWQRSPLSDTAFPKDTTPENQALNRTPRLEEIAHSVYQLSQMKDVSGQIWNLDNRIL